MSVGNRNYMQNVKQNLRKKVLPRMYEADAVIKDKFINNMKHRSNVDPKRFLCACSRYHYFLPASDR